MRELTDGDLLAHCRNGDRQAFNELVRRYQDRVYWVVRRIVGDHEDAKDIAQDTFIRAFHALGDFRGDSSVYTWLYRIATNLGLNHIRKRRVRQFLRLEDVQETADHTGGSADAGMERDEMRTLIERAIAHLPDKQRAVFILRYYEELPYEEIARILKRSTGGLKANYFHAVRKVEEYVRRAM